MLHPLPLSPPLPVPPPSQAHLPSPPLSSRPIGARLRSLALTTAGRGRSARAHRRSPRPPWRPNRGRRAGPRRPSRGGRSHRADWGARVPGGAGGEPQHLCGHVPGRLPQVRVPARDLPISNLRIKRKMKNMVDGRLQSFSQMSTTPPPAASARQSTCVKATN